MNFVQNCIDRKRRELETRQRDFEQWQTTMLANSDEINRILQSKERFDPTSPTSPSNICIIDNDVPQTKQNFAQQCIQSYDSNFVPVLLGSAEDCFTTSEREFLTSVGLRLSTF